MISIENYLNQTNYMQWGDWDKIQGETELSLYMFNPHVWVIFKR